MKIKKVKKEELLYKVLLTEKEKNVLNQLIFRVLEQDKEGEFISQPQLNLIQKFQKLIDLV